MITSVKDHSKVREDPVSFFQRKKCNSSHSIKRSGLFNAQAFQQSLSIKSVFGSFFPLNVQLNVKFHRLTRKWFELKFTNITDLKTIRKRYRCVNIVSFTNVCTSVRILIVTIKKKFLRQ